MPTHSAPASKIRIVSASPSAFTSNSYRQSRVVVPSFISNGSYGGIVATNGVPGLGFDYTHLAAVSGPTRNGSRNHFGRTGNFGQASYVPIFFGGYPYYYDSLDFDQPQPVEQTQQQPQVIVIQQPVAATQQDAAIGSDSTQASSNPTPPAPVPDVGNFVLIRRDGRVLFASAFSVVRTQLEYISPEGIRHSVPMAEMDADATQQMNEARGTMVRLQN
jgi:hypothetical protein